VWDGACNELLWVDIIKGKLFRYDPKTKVNRTTDLRQPVGTVTPHTQDTVVVALIKGICVVDKQTGKLRQSLGNPEASIADNRWNDGKCDPQGRLWVGSMNVHNEGSPGALWCFDGSKWTKKLSDIGVSNGLVWSKDCRSFWYIDSMKENIQAFDFDAETGNITNHRVAVKVNAKEQGYCDGCTIDSEDKIWVAHWEGGSVCRWDPTTGALLEKIPIPGASLVTSCAFGGPNLDQLFVTTASCGLSEEALRTKDSNAGALFRIDFSGTSIRGQGVGQAFGKQRAKL